VLNSSPRTQYVRPLRQEAIEPIAQDVVGYIQQVAASDGLRDKQAEHELGQRISKLRETERWVIINRAIELNELIGLRLARQCLRSVTYFDALFLRAMETRNEETVATWISAIGGSFGPYRALNALRAVRQSLMHDPELVKMALLAIKPLMSNLGTADKIMYRDIALSLDLELGLR